MKRAVISTHQSQMSHREGRELRKRRAPREHRALREHREPREHCEPTEHCAGRGRGGSRGSSRPGGSCQPQGRRVRAERSAAPSPRPLTKVQLPVPLPVEWSARVFAAIRPGFAATCRVDPAVGKSGAADMAAGSASGAARNRQNEYFARVWLGFRGGGEGARNLAQRELRRPRELHLTTQSNEMCV